MLPAEFRDQFPDLEKMVHLYSCSLGPRSTAHDIAFSRMLDLMSSVESPWPAFEHEIARLRSRFAALINTTPDRIALLPDASTGAHQVASTLDWRQRPVIVTSDHEFPSLKYVFQAQQARGAVVTSLPMEPDGSIDVERFVAAIDERTGLVSIPFASYRNGWRPPLGRVVARARQVGAAVLVDAYQAVGVLDVDVERIGCDFLVAGSGKFLLGLPGVAYLYARHPAGSPTLTGWFGQKDPFAFTHTVNYAHDARRYEVGTKGVPAVFAAHAGFDLLEKIETSDIERHVARLTSYATARLAEQGAHLSSPGNAEARGAQVAVLSPDPDRLAQSLIDGGVRTSPRGEALRLAFHYFNTEGDVDVSCSLLRRYLHSR